MMILLALLLAQGYAHRSNPGEPATAGSAVLGTGYGNAICTDTGGADAAFATVAGTWSATLTFVGTNDNGVTTKAIAAYPYASATGLIGPPVTSTTANGDWVMDSSPFRRVCVLASVFSSNTSMTVRLDADPAAYFVTQIDVPSAGFQNDAVTTVVQVKATAAVLYQISATNTTAATAYVQVFCLPSASVTLGTTPPNYVIRLKTNAGAGDERDISFPRGLCSQGTGLSVAGTTTATGLTTAAVSVSAAFL